MINSDFFKELRVKNFQNVLRAEVNISHNGISDGNYAIFGEEIKIKLAISRRVPVENIAVIFRNESGTEDIFRADLILADYDYLSDFYEIKIPKKRIAVGLFYYYFEIKSFGLLYGYRFENSLAVSSAVPTINECYQLTVANNDSKPDITINGIIYHIFVDRFYKAKGSYVKKDAEMIENWYDDIKEYPEYPGAYMKNNTFFGGNLYGIAEKLEYLKALGVSILYLSPIFESPSNHKYDTADYMNVDSMFGGDEGLIYLVTEAKKQDIEIILDGVFNHTGADSIYFNKFSHYTSLGAYQSVKSTYYDWYTFTEHPNEYLCWWGIDILPKINYENSGAEEFFLGDNGVVAKWMKTGIKGFRLDVADELSDEFIQRMKALITKYDSSALLYGEVWEDASNKIAYGKRKKYYLGNELNGVMNYPLREGIISYITKKSTKELDYALNTVLLNMPLSNRNLTMNLLGTHDTERIITALSASDTAVMTNLERLKFRMSKEDYALAKKRLISAYTVIAALPGIPMVYYGDEAGMEGFSDPFNRRTYPWGDQDNEILSHYRKIGKIRRGNTELSNGEFSLLLLNSELLIFQRKRGRARLITVYNNSLSEIKISFSRKVSDIINNKKGSHFVIGSESALIFKSFTRCEIIY